MRENANSNLTNAPAGLVPPTCDADRVRELLARASLPVPDAALCDCEYCRAFAHYARMIHSSVLSTIDVYSIPDETNSDEGE